MWTREELKNNAKIKLKACLIPAILVCFVLYILGAGSSGGGGGNSSGSDDGASVIEDMFEMPEIHSFQDATDALRSNEGAISRVFNGTLGSFLINGPLAILFFAASLLVGLLGVLISILITNPVVVGARHFFIKVQNGTVDKSNMGILQSFTHSFKNGRYANIMITMACRDIFIFLWSLLFVIPGIIKRYEYRMLPYILAENPELDRRRAMELSKEMMMGEKMNAFILDWSFILWDIANSFTCNILALAYLNPYKAATDAELYDVLRGNAIADGITDHYELPGVF